jgi:putative NADH-flavin reductase
MRIAVMGAAGRTGRLAVEKALGHGHDVVAFVHKTQLTVEHPRLTKASGDVLDLPSVRRAIAGCDAVIFALSTGGSTRAHVHEAGIANAIYAMAENHVPRLAVISAAGAFDRSSRWLSLGFRALIATTLRATYDDLEAMERRIMATDFAWSIIRPVGLSDQPPTGHYRISLDGSMLHKSRRVSRGDVASLLLKAVETDTFYRRAVVVGT